MQIKVLLNGVHAGKLSEVLPNLIPQNLEDSVRISFSTNFEFEQAHLILIHFKDLVRADIGIIHEHAEKICVLTSHGNHEHMAGMIKDFHVSHILGQNNQDDLFGIFSLIEAKFLPIALEESSYLPQEMNKIGYTFEDSSSIQEEIDGLLTQVNFDNAFDELKNYVRQVFNELVTNAIYNAPVGKNHDQKYRATSRDTVIYLDENEFVDVKVIDSDQSIALIVTDQFGSLRKEIITHYLTKGEVEQKHGGAGLGFFITLKYVHALILKVDPGKSTQVCIIINKHKRYKSYQTYIKTLLLLYQNEVSMMNDDDLPPDLPPLPPMDEPKDSAIEEVVEEKPQEMPRPQKEEITLFEAPLDSDQEITFESGKLQIDVALNENTAQMNFLGDIDEDFDITKLTHLQNKQHYIFNFDKIEMINSCGIREWIRFIETLPTSSPLEYINCPKIIIQQINMISGFITPSTKVKSFYAPYYCEDCDIEKSTLIKGDDVQNMQAPTQSCDQCGQEMEFDAIEAQYFQFLNNKK